MVRIHRGHVVVQIGQLSSRSLLEKIVEKVLGIKDKYVYGDREMQLNGNNAKKFLHFILPHMNNMTEPKVIQVHLAMEYLSKEHSTDPADIQRCAEIPTEMTDEKHK